MRNHPALNSARNSGMTLVEILITLLVISIGLLGVAGLHSLSLRNNYDALMRSHASALAADITDRMRANRAAALTEGYDIALTDSAPAVESDSPMSVIDLNEWRTALAASLPQGIGQVDMNPISRIVTVTIQWGERGSDMSFETKTEI